MIRVAFRFDDTRLFARLVCLLQGGDSAHCEAAWAWSGAVHQCVSASFVDGGVRSKEITLPPDKWRIYEIDERPQTVVEWYEAHKGAWYDVLGLLGFVVRRIKGWAGAYFCSEVIASILGLRDPYRFDLALMEAVCIRYGRRVQ